jgi:ABC-type xylose transport system permease subunit
MSMFSMQANMQEMVKGLILLAIIVVDKYMENRNQKV